MKELTPKERDILSRAATIGNLERAGQPSYDGTKATAAATSASWQSWLNKAGGDPIKAQRLKTAALLRGRMEARKRNAKKATHLRLQAAEAATHMSIEDFTAEYAPTPEERDMDRRRGELGRAA